MTVSTYVVMATVPEMVAHSMNRMEPLPPERVCRACGKRSLTRWGESCGLFLVSANILARKARGGDGLFICQGEGGFWERQVVLAAEIAAGSAWFPLGIWEISIIGLGDGFRPVVVSRKQSGVCVFEEYSGGEVECKELGPNPQAVFLFLIFLHVLCFFVN